jgi:acyl-CoA thioesterase-1
MKIYTTLLLILSLSFLNCEKNEIEQPIPVTEPPVVDTIIPSPTPKTIHYLALGDSYTIGTSVNYTERFPKQLIESLRRSDTTNVYAEPGFVARNGWTTIKLTEALTDNDTLQNKYDLVSLLIGVNNQYQNRPFSIYEEQFPALLSTAIQLAGGDTTKVFVVSIPDYAYTPFGQQNGNPSTISGALDEYNAYNRQIAETWGVTYFNITPISREGLERTELVASDNLHPSGIQYEEWVDRMIEEVLDKVK